LKELPLQKFAIFAIFASSEMFRKLGNYRNISEIRKTAISKTHENENFGKKRLTQGPSLNEGQLMDKYVRRAILKLVTRVAFDRFQGAKYWKFIPFFLCSIWLPIFSINMNWWTRLYHHFHLALDEIQTHDLPIVSRVH